MKRCQFMFISWIYKCNFSIIKIKIFIVKSYGVCVEMKRIKHKNIIFDNVCDQ